MLRTDERKDKQEVVIGFIQKLILPRDMLNERVCSKFKHLRCVVAQNIAMKICKNTLQTDVQKKQEVDIEFIQKGIALCGTLLERVC